ncbi:MAG TPA: MFS transporter, partial [Vicinamibacteria bacterium]|nr:MFS transporter [Vicinamibacteria bacterium]
MTVPPAIARRNQLVTVAMVFAVFTGFAFVLPFLPLYVAELGVSDARVAALWAGVLISVAPLVAGLVAPVWGRLADLHGHRRIALAALLCDVVVLLLSAAVTRVDQLLALRVGVGLFGGIGPLGLAMATAQAPREETGHAVGLVQAAQILSAAVGPIGGGLLADSIGIRRVFVATAGLCALALLLVLAFYREGPRDAARPAARAGSLVTVVAVPGVAALLGVLFLVNFIGRSFTPILPLHLSELGLPPGRLASGTGLLISVYSVAAAASAAALGRLSRDRSPRSLLLLTLVGGACAVLPMALATRFPQMLLLALFLGLVSGGSLTVCYTIGGLMVPAQVRTTAFGFFSGAALLGGALSPPLAALLLRLSLRTIYWVDGVLYLALAGTIVTGGLLPASQVPGGRGGAS